jgi:hypothetical protein
LEEQTLAIPNLVFGRGKVMSVFNSIAKPQWRWGSAEFEKSREMIGESLIKVEQIGQ